jgi:ribonuclease-3
MKKNEAKLYKHKNCINTARWFGQDYKMTDANSASLFNPVNKLITLDEVSQLLKQFGIKNDPVHIEYYQKAFIHKSYCLRKNDDGTEGNELCPSNCLPLQNESYERQEYLGDAILNTVIADYLYRRYFYESEGFLTRMRTKIVNGIMLGNISKQIGLDRYVIIAASLENNGGRINTKTLEDVFEAFISSIFIDFNFQSGTGFQVATTWIVNVVENCVDLTELILANDNYKERLIRYLQIHYGVMPKFQEKSKNDIEGITVIVLKENDVIGIGKGENKKVAEIAAALNALQFFGVITK